MDPQALGAAAHARRIELQMLQCDVVARSGLSLSTVSAIERGLADNLRPKSLAALDRALQWEEGTAAFHYSGMTTVREAIRKLGGKPPRGSTYRDLLLALAQMTDEDIDMIVSAVRNRQNPDEGRHSA